MHPWYDLLDGVAAGACQPVLAVVQDPFPPFISDGIDNATKAYANVYKGTPRDALGLAAAKIDLDQATNLIAALETPSGRGSPSPARS